MSDPIASLIGTQNVQITQDVAAFDCQDKTQTTLPTGCVITIESYEPRDPAAYAHNDGYLVWLVANECGDPTEDMCPERWYIADAEQLILAVNP